MNSWTRIALALSLGLVLGTVVSFSNGRDFLSSLQAGLVFALVVGAMVALLSWGVAIAAEKGYPGWLGFLLVLIVNVVGLVILLLLPARSVVNDKSKTG